MGDKGGKKNKEKSQIQHSDMHNQKESIKFKKQHQGQPVPELQSEKAVSKDKMAKSLNANMKAVEKSNK
jgi:hypothetical protein